MGGTARAPESWKAGGLGSGIPAPTGQYRVGCVDLMHQLEGDERGLLLRLHYPTEATPEAGYTYTPWSPHRNYIKGYMNVQKAKVLGFFSTIISGIIAPKIPALGEAPLFGSQDKTEAPKIPALGEAPLFGSRDKTEDAESFPVIVFSHGLGAMRTTYSATVCDLASHGYIVACLEHRDGSAAMSYQKVPKVGGGEGELQDQWIEFLHFDSPPVPEDPLGNAEKEFPLRNKQVRQRASEVGKTLDILTLLNKGAEIKDMLGGGYNFKQFKGRLDISAAAVMGHSFGGATTIQTLSEDNRFKCGIALDCWMIPIHSDIYSNSSSISQPLYFINSHNFQWVLNVKRMVSLTRPLDANATSQCRILTLDGTNHLNQCDIPLILPRIVVRLNWGETSLAVETAHRVNMEICHAFFKRHFLKDPAYQQTVPNLDGTEGHSEHIIFGTNVNLSNETPSDSAKPSEKSTGGDSEEGRGGTGDSEEGRGGTGDSEEGHGGIGKDSGDSKEVVKNGKVTEEVGGVALEGPVEPTVPLAKE